MEKKILMAVFLLLMVVSLVFAVKGVSMHKQVASEEAAFHALQDEYFSLDKATRDGAEADSTLSDQLVEIKNYPSELMELKLVGVGKILTGIYVLLFAILIALIVMPIRLSEMMKKKKK
jgi:hypothetical protein